MYQREEIWASWQPGAAYDYQALSSRSECPFTPRLVRRPVGLSHARSLTVKYSPEHGSLGHNARRLSRLRRLAFLTIVGLRRDEDLRWIRGLENLESLHLDDVRLTSRGARHLRELPRLSTLIIRGRIEGGLEHVADNQSLSTLVVHVDDISTDELGDLCNSSITHLQMSGMRLGPEHVRALEQFMKLRVLDVSEAEIYLEHVRHLRSLIGLRVIDRTTFNTEN